MNSLHHNLAAVTDAAANLIAQLSELNRLRERVRKAERSAQRRQLQAVNIATKGNHPKPESDQSVKFDLGPKGNHL